MWPGSWVDVHIQHMNTYHQWWTSGFRKSKYFLLICSNSAKSWNELVKSAGGRNTWQDFVTVNRYSIFILSYSESCLVLVCVSCLLGLVISIWHSVILALVFPSYVSVFMFTFDLNQSTPVSVSRFGYFRVSCSLHCRSYFHPRLLNIPALPSFA